MKRVFSLLILMICSYSYGDQEIFKKDLFKDNVYPFLVKNCAQCHSEKAKDPIGPAHSHSKPETAFLEFNKRTRIDNITKSTMWRVGANGHFCKDHNVNCDNLTQIEDEFKAILDMYVSEVQAAFPKEEIDKNQVVINGDLIKADFEVAKDIYDRPVIAKIEMTRLENSEYVILEDLRLYASSGAFFLDGLDILVNEQRVSKNTGFEDLQRYVLFSTEKGYFVDPNEYKNTTYTGRGKVLAPFKPMFKYVVGDRLDIKLRSLKQLRRANSVICDYLENESNDMTYTVFATTLSSINKILSSYNANMEHYGIVQNESTQNQCITISQLIDLKNPNHSPLLLEASEHFVNSSKGGERYGRDSINKITGLLIEANYDLNKYSYPDDEDVYTELVGNENFNLVVLENPELAKGLHLYNTAGCVNCHGKDLSGGLKLTTPGGNFFTPNISSDDETGIGRWSLNDFEKAMKEGLSPDGDKYFAAFPYTTYRNMKPEDIEILFDYIKATKPQYKVNKEHQPSFMANLPLARGIWRALDTQPQFIEDLLQGDSNFAKGAYNALAITHCAECHTPRTKTFHLDYNRWMEGGLVYDNDGNPETAPAIKDMASKGWTLESYKYFLKTGETHKGGFADGKMAEVINNQTSKLNEEELKNLVDYLMSL